MPSLSALKDLGKANAPSLKTTFSTYLLDWGKISHLVPHHSTQNLVYLYDQEKQPALVQKQILLANLSSHELSPDTITFPPRDIETNGLSKPWSDRPYKSECGDIFLWKTRSGNVLGCWVLQALIDPMYSGRIVKGGKPITEDVQPRIKTWTRVNVRRANLRHPLDSNFELEVDTDGVVGWVPVQIFAANSLVRDHPPPPDFENLGKIYELANFKPVHLFLIRHEDSNEKNICYVRSGPPQCFEIGPKDPSVMTGPGDLYIDIVRDKITPKSLIRKKMWVLSKGHIWSEIERVNGEHQARRVRHPVHPDYVLEPPTLRSLYPQWVFEPKGVVDGISISSHDMHAKDAPITDARSKGAVPPGSSGPVCGQKRSAMETPGTIESEQSNGHGTVSTWMKKKESFGAKKRKVADVVHIIPSSAGSSKASEGRSKMKPFPILPIQRSRDIVDVVSPQPSASVSLKISKTADNSTIAPDAHDNLKQRLDKMRKKYIIQKETTAGLRNSLLEAQDSLQKYRTEAQQKGVDRQAEISALVEKLQGRSQEVQQLSDEAQATKALVRSLEKALEDEKIACSLVTSQLEQLQKSSLDYQRQNKLLRKLSSDAEAKLDAANSELSEIRDAVDRLQRENGVKHAALADAVNVRAAAESRVQTLEATMKDLLQKHEEYERIAQHNARLDIELQITKDEMTRSVDTAKQATSRITALEETCADHERTTDAVNGELSRAREEISQLRCDIKHKASLEIELQRTKEEMERSADTAEKAKSQVTALEEICVNHERNADEVDKKLSRAREEISQLRCDVQHKTSLESELQQTKDEIARSVDTAKKATSRVAALEEICADHERTTDAVNGELSRARDEIRQLHCDVKHKASLEIELQRTKEEIERSADTAEKARSQVAALEEVCANHERNADEVDKKLSRAREEISQLRCDVQHKTSLEIELQRTKEEMERSADTAKKAKSQVAALEEICANHEQNYSAVDEELSRARVEISQLRCDVEHKTNLEIELQRTKEEMERSTEIAQKAKSQVAALEEICANNERNASAVNEEFSRARKENSQLRCDITTREEVIARETKAREDSDAALSSTKNLLEQERSGFTTALSGIQDELCAEQVRRRSSEEALEAIRRECRSPFTVPILMDLFLEMGREGGALL